MSDCACGVVWCGLHHGNIHNNINHLRDTRPHSSANILVRSLSLQFWYLGPGPRFLCCLHLSGITGGGETTIRLSLFTPWSSVLDQTPTNHPYRLSTVLYLTQQERNDLEKIVSELLQRNSLLRISGGHAGVVWSEEDDHDIYLSNVLLLTIFMIGNILLLATSICLVENVWKNGKQHPRIISCIMESYLLTRSY